MRVQSKVNGVFLVQLNDEEKAARAADLVTLHMENARREDVIQSINANLKAEKDEVKSLRSRMAGVARVIHTGREQQTVEGALVEVDTSTWVEVVSHPKDGRVLRERLLPEEERDSLRQGHLFVDQAAEEAETPAPRKARKPKSGALLYPVANDDVAADEAAEAAARG
jgi:hypothetical protein